MLVLTRNPQETIHIGDDVIIRLVSINDGISARIGIVAPHHIPVLRGELVGKPRPLNGGVVSRQEYLTEEIRRHREVIERLEKELENGK